ncbi:MAG: PQQ-binding-like beta-propeller repeat protein [Methylacidiphilales bacterium]|nr:PQQ-binding-like beta-propeller repeat protein [Candidatus Methylacidiphilales bacterium]
MKTRSLLYAVIGFLCSLQPAVIQAADWPGYRGSVTDGVSTENLNLNWSASPPKVLWKVPTKSGFGSFSVCGGKVFTEVERSINGASHEVCVALDPATGKELWFADLGVGNGNSTPAESDGVVCVLTKDLVLHALDAATGNSLWTHDLIKEYAAHNIGWESAASPVIDGDLVFVMGGGDGQSLLAFNKKSGELGWKTGTEAITHATPVLATILGERQVIFFCQSGLVSLSTKDGKLLWKFPYKFKTSTAASPVVSGDIVYCSAGYDVGGGACKIARQGSGFTATQLWQTPGNLEVANHWSTPVCRDGYLYGMFSFKQEKVGPLKCVEIATGKVMWVQSGFGQGNAIVAGGKVLALSDKGDLVVVEPAPDAYKELGRFTVVKGDCRSTPAVSNGCIYVRSSEEGACIDVSAP